MRIDRVELRLVRLPLVQFFETSFGRIHDREFIVVMVTGTVSVDTASVLPTATLTTVLRLPRQPGTF